MIKTTSVILLFDIIKLLVAAPVIKLAGTVSKTGGGPVTSDKSKSYRENKNEALFPTTFNLSYQSNVELGHSILKRAHDNHSNVYFMPIITEPMHYLTDVPK